MNHVTRVTPGPAGPLTSIGLWSLLSLAAPFEPQAAPKDDPVTLTSLSAQGVALDCQSSLEVEFDETDVMFMIDGEDGPDHERRLHAFLGQDIEWTERVEDVSAGRPIAVTRSFSSVRGQFAFEGLGERQNIKESTGDFEGRTVRFDWDAEAEEYDREFEERTAGDLELEEHLAGLRPRVDFAGFLPKTEVSIGDSWTIDGDAFAAAFSPSGDLALDPDHDRLIALGSYTGFTSPIAPITPARWFIDLTADTDDGARVELIEISQDGADGPRVAVLEVKADLTSMANLSPWLKGFETDHFEPFIETFDLETRVDGEGRLHWDIDAGRVRSWSFEGDLHLEMDAAWELRPSKTYLLESIRSMEGEIRSSFECRAVPDDR